MPRKADTSYRARLGAGFDLAAGSRALRRRRSRLVYTRCARCGAPPPLRQLRLRALCDDCLVDLADAVPPAVER